MKKAPLSPKHQARRARALERFSTRRPPFDSSPDALKAYEAYLVRKQQELATLKQRLGV